MRAVVLCFTVLVTLFALNSHLSIYKMVENAYKVTLVSAFVPLAFGLYWKRANQLGARSRSCSASSPGSVSRSSLRRAWCRRSWPASR